MLVPLNLPVISLQHLGSNSGVKRRWRGTRTGNAKESLPYTSHYRERHTNNATEMSPYARFAVSFLFILVQLFPSTPLYPPQPSELAVRIVKVRLTAVLARQSAISQQRKNPPTTGKRFEILSDLIAHRDNTCHLFFLKIVILIREISPCHDRITIHREYGTQLFHFRVHFIGTSKFY